jgi:thiol-disulfide isomerase/thioredoxin
MKKIMLILALFVATNAFSQTTTTTKSAPIKLDENSVVIDEAGNQVMYKLWQAYLRTGEYTIKRLDGEPSFKIYKMSPEEKVLFDKRRLASMATSPRPALSKNFKDGEKFAAERITSIDGLKFDMKTDKDKIYVINFWFIDCPPCKQEIPELNELVNSYKDNPDVVFLAIALDEKYDLKKFIKTNPFLYNIVEGRYYANKYNVKAYPTHVVVGKDGLVKFHTVGLASNTVYWINKTIKELL